MKKLREDWSQEMLATIPCRIFCLPLCYPKMYRLDTQNCKFACCETWSLKLREECRLMFFENRVLRRIFWPKKDEVTGVDKELYAQYSSPDIIRVIISRRLWSTGHAVGMGIVEVHTGFWCGNVRWGGHMEGPGLYGRTVVNLRFP